MGEQNHCVRGTPQRHRSERGHGGRPRPVIWWILLVGVSRLRAIDVHFPGHPLDDVVVGDGPKTALSEPHRRAKNRSLSTKRDREVVGFAASSQETTKISRSLMVGGWAWTCKSCRAENQFGFGAPVSFSAMESRIHAVAAKVAWSLELPG